PCPMDMVETDGRAVVVHEGVALDATVTDGDWSLIQQLRREGVTDGGLHRLLRPRARYQDGAALDGLATDRHTQFARWLVVHGRLHEGGADSADDANN